MQARIQSFLRSMGIDYLVKRDGFNDRSERGLKNREQDTGKAFIGFMPGTDIAIGDILENPAGDIFYVVEVETQFFQGKPHQLKAFYQTEVERKAAPQPAQSVFNIGTAYGSVIGNENQAVINYNSSAQDLKEKVNQSDSPDKEDMEKIVSLLEMVVNNQVPPSKGLFSKFSEVMERHSWLSNSVAGTIFAWLTSKIQ